MSHKSFESAVAEHQQEPITFDIGTEEVFTVPLPLPALPLTRLVANSDRADAQAVAVFLDFFAAALQPGDYERFDKAATLKRIDAETLVAIVKYIVEESTGRPLEESKSSSDSLSTTSLSSVENTTAAD